MEEFKSGKKEIIHYDQRTGKYILESGLDGEIAFNVNYLIDFINAVKPESLEFGMNESLKPAIFKDKKIKDYFYIAMPFRVNT